MDDRRYMLEALALAEEAGRSGEIPVGAVVVRNTDGEIIGRGKNDKEARGCALGHAELNAIAEATSVNRMYLSGCTLYVTLEPCPMCAGAIINSRCDRVVYALKDPKAGAFGSLLNLNSYPLNHKVSILTGICEEESLLLLREFFKNKRKSI